MAVQCYCVRFAQSDHQFLHESHVFSNISRILSKSEEENDDSSIDSSLVSVCACVCVLESVCECLWVLFCVGAYLVSFFVHSFFRGFGLNVHLCVGVHLLHATVIFSCLVIAHFCILKQAWINWYCALNVLVPSLLSVVMGLLHLLHGFCECLGFWLITSLLLLMLGNVFEFSGTGIKDKNHSVHVGALVLV